MKKYFNIAGPCNPTNHYMVPPLERNRAILPLIEQQQYFVIHAARQTGKTTLLQQLVSYINQRDDYYALYCSLEAAKEFTKPKEGIPAILSILKHAVKYSQLPNKANFGKAVDLNDTPTLIKGALTEFCLALDKPLIVFFDEIDGLQNGTLITFLTQLRNGYVTRSSIPFPHSIALVGLRNIRDYKARIRENRQTLGSTSPFNIITKALTLNNFSIGEVEILYQQHTQATGQVFEKEVTERIYDHSDGQPWLVNAIAREIITELLENDYTQKISSELVKTAINNIIIRRDTHIDSLLERLKEERVRKVMEPVITGEKNVIDFADDDTQYCADLGLIKISKGSIEPANKIYQEVIIRALSYNTQAHLVQSIQNVWVQKDGSLNMDGLLQAFQQFWRENSGIWEEKYQYKEAAPHLILQAFLQRVINSGGRIAREYAANRDRMDLCVHYGDHKYPIEIKIHRDQKTVPDGLVQLAAYMDTLGEPKGWLVVFDRRKKKNWDEKIYWKPVVEKDKTIIIVGA
ncbi:MAG: AAA-like domain-containing protein [Bacteroidota bacterium]